MTDENTQAEASTTDKEKPVRLLPVEQDKFPSAIKRKEKDKKEVELALTWNRVERGPFADYQYPSIQCNNENFSSFVEAVGQKKIFELINRYYLREGQNAALDHAAKVEFSAHPTTGKKDGWAEVVSFDFDKWLEAITSGRCRGETLGELKDTCDAKLKELRLLTGKLAVIDPATGKPGGDPEIIQQMTALAEEIGEIQANIDEKKSKGKGKSVSDPQPEEE